MLPAHPRPTLSTSATVMVAGAMALAMPVAAQQPSLQRDYPTTGPYECPVLPVAVAPDRDQAQRAQQLITDATQAQILGDVEGSRTLLAQAAEADPTSAEVAYLHARSLEELGFPDGAITEYCRAIDLGAADQGIIDSRERLDALYEVVRERISPVAREAFIEGLSEYDSGFMALAEESFTTAVDQAPEWPSAIFNRAVVREQLGLVQESLADYRRYLELSPTEIDPVVAMVAERIGALERAIAAPTPSPAGAFTLGAIFPGMGQYYSGRALSGTVVLTAAATAVTTGLLVKKVTVRCLDPSPSGGECAPDDIVGESTERPFLLPAVVTAGGVTLAAAIEAFVRARGRRSERDEAAGQILGMELVPPSVTPNALGGMDVNVFSLRFR